MFTVVVVVVVGGGHARGHGRKESERRDISALEIFKPKLFPGLDARELDTHAAVGHGSSRALPLPRQQHCRTTDVESWREACCDRVVSHLGPKVFLTGHELTKQYHLVLLIPQ